MRDVVAEILLDVNAVILRTNPPFRWASGILSPIYTDNRVLMSYPKQRNVIIDSFLSLVKKNKLQMDGFAATATAGIPWASWITYKLKKPMVYVRSESKDHGRENLIEGKIEQGKAYVVVEDLISTGSSSINTIQALREKGAKVDYCIAIFTYEMESAKLNFENANAKLLTLTNFSSFVETALKKKYISKQELVHIMDWKKHPQGWTNV